MEPAHSIIQKFGGPTAVAHIVGVHRTRVSNWMRPKQSGGTGGTIPLKHVPKLLAYGEAHDIEIAPADFMPASTAMEGRAA